MPVFPSLKEETDRVLATNDYRTPAYPSLISESSLKYLRITLILPCILMVLLGIHLFPLAGQLVMVTNLGNHIVQQNYFYLILIQLCIVIISTILCIKLSGNEKGTERARFWCVTLLEVGLCMQLITVIVYWTLLHEVVIENSRRERPEEFRLIYLWQQIIFKWQVSVHSYPCAAIVVNIMLSRVNFILNHARYFGIIGIIYMGINYAATVKRGIPIYHFLPWDGPIFSNYFTICGFIFPLTNYRLNLYALHQL